MSDPISMTLAEARDALKARKLSSTELTAALVRSVEQSRGLNAFVTETPDRAMAMAAASDARLAKGEGGALEGLPLAIKDLFCTKGVKTT
ncbi:MAG: amidase family protein, partial [Rhizomicrobium sp.]